MSARASNWAELFWTFFSGHSPAACDGVDFCCWLVPLRRGGHFFVRPIGPLALVAPRALYGQATRLSPFWVTEFRYISFPLITKITTKSPPILATGLSSFWVSKILCKNSTAIAEQTISLVAKGPILATVENWSRCALMYEVSPKPQTKFQTKPQTTPSVWSRLGVYVGLRS